jgi:hypothetical protein
LLQNERVRDVALSVDPTAAGAITTALSGSSALGTVTNMGVTALARTHTDAVTKLAVRAGVVISQEAEAFATIFVVLPIMLVHSA